MNFARVGASVVALAGVFLSAEATFAGDREGSVDLQLAQARAADDRVLRLCNQSARVAEVAKAAPAGNNASDGRPLVESRGWYHVQPGECITLYGPGLTQRYYYYYAQSDSATWAGQYPACVSNRAFAILDAQCGEGYMRRNFTQVDMGSTSGSFTVNLK